MRVKLSFGLFLLCFSLNVEAMNEDIRKLWQEELITLSSILELSTHSGNANVSKLSGLEIKQIFENAALKAVGEINLPVAQAGVIQALGKQMVSTVAAEELFNDIKDPALLTKILWRALLPQVVPTLVSVRKGLHDKLPSITEAEIQKIILELLDCLNTPTAQVSLKNLLPEVQTFIATYTYRLAVLVRAHHEKEIDAMLARIQISNGRSFKEEFYLKNPEGAVALEFSPQAITLELLNQKSGAQVHENKNENP